MDMKDFWVLAKPIVAGQVRNGMAIVSGALITTGVLSPADKGQFVTMATGIVIGMVPVAWSWVANVGWSRLVAFAAKTHPVAPAGSTTGEALKAATDAKAAVVAK